MLCHITSAPKGMPVASRCKIVMVSFHLASLSVPLQCIVPAHRHNAVATITQTTFINLIFIRYEAQTTHLLGLCIFADEGFVKHGKLRGVVIHVQDFNKHWDAAAFLWVVCKDTKRKPVKTF